MKRREFIILTGAGATGATVLSSCGHPEERLIPALIPDDEYVPGIDYWKTSTCGMCSAGCGIIVRTREHKANKIEGNPRHPVNRGALCARGQAGLQLLYNPDRIRSPLKRTGERGAGHFAEISWDEALQAVIEKLSELRDQEQSLLFLSAHPDGVGRLAVETLASEFGGMRLAAIDSEAGAWPPTYDIANARYLLSFGARFLETWRSPVMYSLAYGEFRRGIGRPRGKFVQIEPRMSLTGANADQWLPAKPGSEWLVALSIAQVIVRESLVNDEAMQAFRLPGTTTDPSEFQPEQTAERTGVPADTLIRIAREFAASQPGLAMGSGTLVAGEQDHEEEVQLLNQLVGNMNKPGGVYTATPRFDPLNNPRRVEWAAAGEIPGGHNLGALLVHHANPVYTHPGSADRINAIPLIVSFSSFMDETTELADLILPDHTFLERWDLIAVNHVNGGPTASLMQPVVKPEFNTRQTADVLIELMRGLGVEPRFESAEDAVKQAVERLAGSSGSEEEESSEDYWTAFAERGVWTGETAESAPAQVKVQEPAARTSSKPAEAEQEDRPLLLLIYEHTALRDGSFANLPFLQELPDPLTSVMWGSWVEINPRTAASLGIGEGDLVEVSTVAGTVTVPAVHYPAIRPDVIAMPAGQGHSSLGRYARSRGVNAARLLPSGAGPRSAIAVRAKVTKLPGSRGELITFGGSLPEHPRVKR